jgi:hypothetical protein
MPVPKAGWVLNVLADRSGATRWDLPRNDRPVEELMGLAQWLSGRRVDATGGLSPLDVAELRRAGEQARAALR